MMAGGGSCLVQNVLLVDVFDQDVEWFRRAVHSRIELEVGRDRQLDAQHGARNGLDMGREVEARKLVHEAVDRFAHLWEAHEFADLLPGQVRQRK